MQELLAPIQSPSLKDVFIERFESLILSGQLKIGQKLPSERELALRLGVSRPVVHSGLVDLEAKGLIALTPRVGAVVSDYRQEGSLALLNSLVAYQQGRLEPDLQQSLLDVRRLFEVETARLAGSLRSRVSRGAPSFTANTMKFGYPEISTRYAVPKTFATVDCIASRSGPRGWYDATFSARIPPGRRRALAAANASSVARWNGM